MKKALSFSLFSLVLLLLSGRGYAQRLEALIQQHTATAKAERLYLHYDKAAYAPGDTVWFKAYLMSEFFPSEESKTIYIDWLDEKGALLHHSLSPVYEASTYGQFLIPEKYKGQSLQVRAYTRWMLNFDSAFLYTKQLRILAPAEPSTAKVKRVTTIQFLPEGGEAIGGLKNRIAFKATDQWGGPVAVSGTVHDGSGASVQTFKTVHNGMGAFTFIPKAGQSYSAKWKDEAGVLQTTPLPPIRPEGVTLQVAVSGARRIATIERGATGPAGPHILVGTMFGNPVFSTAVDLSERPAATKIIPTVGLPTGILVMTLFDGALRAVAERITFVKSANYRFPTEVKVVQYGLSKRAKNEWDLVLPDSIEANISIAVTDAGTLADSSENIFSHLFLSSELKGTIHRPAAYFQNDSDTTDQQLDLVMLTHGWRRFKWEDVVSGRPFTTRQPRDSSYLAFSGKVYGVQPGRLANETLIAILKQKDSAASQMLMVPIKGSGYFEQPDFLFFDTLQVFYQFRKGSSLTNSTVRFMESRLGPLDLGSVRTLPLRAPIDTTGMAYQLQRSRERAESAAFLSARTLTNVTVRGRAKSRIDELDKRYTSGLFSGADSYQFDLTEDRTVASALNIFQYLQGKVAGLQISSGQGTPTLQWRGGTPTLYLDEMPIQAESAASLAVTDIAYIKVFRPPFMGGFNGAGGAIALYSKRGDEAQAGRAKGLDNSTITGYTPIKEFYSPNYGTADARHEQRDLRTTLYWNPFILTGPKKSKVRIRFYNNDVTPAFRVIVEGVSKDGQLTRFESIIE